jgi:hypothetical protein
MHQTCEPEHMDPREAELSDINGRLKCVVHLLKSGCTINSLDDEISKAEEGLGDTSDVYIFHDSGVFKGPRHLQSLLKIDSAMETKHLFAGKKNIQNECVQLLERKLALVKGINGIH